MSYVTGTHELSRGSSLIGKHYRERLVRRGRHAASVRNFVRAWDHYNVWCEAQGVDPSQIEPWQVEEYFYALTYAATTKAMMLAQVRAAYRYALQRGFVDRDPTVDVELPKPADRQVVTISNARLREMRDRCYSEREWLMWHLFVFTGCRKNEIRELTWENVSLENNTIFVVGKGGRSRLVPVHPALSEALSSTRPKANRAILCNPYGRPYHYTYLDNILKAFATEAVSFHDFRRTVASSLDANGVEEGLIMRIMGWSPKTVFDRHYRHVAPERLQAAILKLYADDPL